MPASGPAPSVLARSDWRRYLHSGDEVRWRDPVGVGTRTERIVGIEYTGMGDTAVVQWADGTATEVQLSELS
jgi:hypothetical protein